MDWNKEIISENVVLDLPDLRESGVEVWLKREDLIHPQISGNKWRKLKYHILEVLNNPYIQGIVTKGGAYSNHVLATAAASAESGLQCMGFIRGEEVLPLNPTLSLASQMGMQLCYVDRTMYKDSLEQLSSSYGLEDAWKLVPEGGTDLVGIKGCTEILTQQDKEYFHSIAISMGTGGTAAGLLSSKSENQSLNVFPALKGMNVRAMLSRWSATDDPGLHIRSDYSFGGYARINNELIQFIKSFERNTGIQLDPIYTAKMMYGLLDLVKKGSFDRGTSILAIHTGGLQGRKGMEERLGIDFSI